MHCKSCGAEVADDMLFCMKCGQQVKKVEESIEKTDYSETKDVEVVHQTIIPEENFNNESEEVLHDSSNGHLLKKVCIGIVLVLLAIVAIVGLNYINEHRGGYNLSNYVVFSDEGANGDGTTQAYFDEDALIYDIANDKGVEVAEVGFLFATENIPKVEIVSENSGLSNGDKVRAKIIWSVSLARDLGVKFRGNIVTHTVEGLTDGWRTGNDIDEVVTEDHIHTYIYEPFSEEKHNKLCELCDYREEENCIYGDNGKCICGNEKISSGLDKIQDEFYHKYESTWVNPVNNYFITIKGTGETLSGSIGSDLIYKGQIDNIEEIEDGYVLSGTDQFIGYTEDEEEYEIEDFELYIKRTQMDPLLINIGKDEPYYLYNYGGVLENYFDNYESINDSFITAVEIVNPESLYENPVGRWLTDASDDYKYDDYEIKLDENNYALCIGIRDMFSGKYEQISPNKLVITFDRCISYIQGSGWEIVDDYLFMVDMIIDGNSARIEVNEPRGITLLSGGNMYRGEDTRDYLEGEE